ncbi:YggT family protein [Sphingomonas sp.]|uniref:YggT family protein n=1 Tax=Sphingomonas sp. TaxID=28214 RepID=UPI001E0E5ADD|nr:YggT family protein [Sphingomonas sp.]MBX9795850.1 YggT family protein [Sphingomonas sp.]
MILLLQIMQVLLNLAWLIIIVQIVLSLLIAFNVINTYNDFVRQLYGGLTQLTEPVYRPIRRILPDFGQIDFSPAVALLGIQLLGIVLTRLAIAASGGVL